MFMKGLSGCWWRPMAPLTLEKICQIHEGLSGSRNLNPDNVALALQAMGGKVARVTYEIGSSGVEYRYALVEKLDQERLIGLNDGIEPPSADELDVVEGSPGYRRILNRQFERFDWNSLAVGDWIEGVGLVQTPALCSIISKQMLSHFAEQLQEDEGAPAAAVPAATAARALHP